MEINDQLADFLKTNEKLKVESREQSVETFKATLSSKFKKKDKADVYTNALNKAMDIVFECTKLSFEEILQRFSTTDNVLVFDSNVNCYTPIKKSNYVVQRLHRDINNIVTGLKDSEIPKRFDTKLNKYVPIEFRVSWMYRNDKFVERCKNYYSQFGLDIEFEHVDRIVWRVHLISKDGNIYLKEPRYTL